MKKAVKLKEEGREVVIVGHSLGGGLASIVASIVEIPGVSISGPGIVNLYKKLRIGSKEHISENVISIFLSHDPVPAVDTHIGSVFSIPCVESRSDLCHMPGNLFCIFARTCPHPSKTFQKCSFTSQFN